MLDSLRARQPGNSLRKIAWWAMVQTTCYIWCATFYRHRTWGLHHIPSTGPVLLLSNHQSFLDPVAVGVACHRRQFYALARSSLFTNPILGWLIGSINAIPVRRGEMDMVAMRLAIQALKRGQAMLIFPEGTRTPDGKTKAFSKGTLLLVKRAKPMIVPVAVEGAYDVWPKERRVPRMAGRIGVSFGKPISADELIAMGAEDGLESVRQTIEGMRLDLADRLSRR